MALTLHGWPFSPKRRNGSHATVPKKQTKK